MKILLIGPTPPPVGGATVLFQLLLDELNNEKQIQYKVISTSRKKRNIFTTITLSLRIFIHLILSVKSFDIVSYHASVSSAYKLGPLIFLFCRLYNKPLIFRGFGGNFHIWHEKATPPIKYLFNNTLLSADTILFETLQSVNYFKLISKTNVTWFPNYRKKTHRTLKKAIDSAAKKFVYIGHVKESKGIKLILDASDKVSEDVSIEVFGPLQEGITIKDFQGHRAKYGGILNSKEVSKKLLETDALLFPSHYEGEGYPGVILEAFACGKPVIATNWKAIPEIVDETCGILIQPRNYNEIAFAINNLSSSSEQYVTLCKGALAKANEYSAEIWTQFFIEIVHKQRILYETRI